MTSSSRSLLVVLAVVALLGVSPVAGSASEGSILSGLLGSSSAEAPTAVTKAPDGTLRAGCRDYPLRYKVKGAGKDWRLDLAVRDRSGATVASLTLHGVSSPRKGRTSFSVCRSAVKAGRFSVSGVLTDRDGYQQTDHTVERHRFWLTRR